MANGDQQSQRSDNALALQKGNRYFKLYLILLIASIVVCFALSFRGDDFKKWWLMQNIFFVRGTTEFSTTEETLFFDEYAKIFHVPNITCANLFAGSGIEIAAGRQLAKDMKDKLPLLRNEFFIEAALNCDRFIRSRGYITSYLTPEERDFPIAFSIMVYKDAEMVDRLLRAIYRPQNYYCIHGDGKSETKFLQAMGAIASCFPNVIVPTRRINISWGEMSVLEAELLCMKELLSRSRKWKYFINLTGQEFPLKTNAELVQILTAYNGANDVEAILDKKFHFRVQGRIPPAGVRFVKGSVHICVNRKFVEYVIHNETAHQMLDWVNGTFIPDETYFTSLNHNPHLGIPGSYTGYPQTNLTHEKPFLTRFKNWGEFPADYPCAGYRTRSVCILSTGDLPLLSNRPEMFANKFHLDADRVVIGCLEEKHFNDTRDRYYGRKLFNSTFYETLGFVKNKIPVWTAEV